MSRKPRAILTDIEGTTTRIAFVRDVLFPYARHHLPALLEQSDIDPQIAAAVSETRALAPDMLPLDALLQWMDADAKITPLKTLQGLAWLAGYQRGELQGHLYADVAPALRRWHASGQQLEVYSSGSVAAQRLLFAHSDAGDLTPLLSGFHDTRSGSKRDPNSYATITAASVIPPAEWLFLSDTESELDAAATAGLRTCQLVRADDHTAFSNRHPTATDFAIIERSWDV